MTVAGDLKAGDTVVVPGNSYGHFRDPSTTKTVESITYYPSTTHLSGETDPKGQVMAHFTDGTRHLWRSIDLVALAPITTETV